MSRDEFIRVLLEDQPFIPKYFGHDVVLNRQGASPFEESIRRIPRFQPDASLEPGILIIDTRTARQFRAGHLPGAINLMDGAKFETWLGSVVGSKESYYLLADSQIALDTVIRKTAKIGYETNIKGALVALEHFPITSSEVDVARVRQQPEDFTIVDIRNPAEARQPIFENALRIPLPELRERAHEVPTHKPVLVHCAGGYRSAAGASILEAALPGVPVYDLGEIVSTFQAQVVH